MPRPILRIGDAVCRERPTYAGPVKEFWIYTALRLGLFVGAFCIVFGIWFLIDDESVNLFIVMIVAFLLSGVASLIFLDQQRNAFAQRVERRAGRISEKYDEMRAKEDRD
ncbi:hypothetical protein GCM10025786_19280 [Nocardioides caeni]